MPRVLLLSVAIVAQSILAKTMLAQVGAAAACMRVATRDRPLRFPFNASACCDGPLPGARLCARRFGPGRRLRRPRRRAAVAVAVSALLEAVAMLNFASVAMALHIATAAGGSGFVVFTQVVCIPMLPRSVALIVVTVPCQRLWRMVS